MRNAKFFICLIAGIAFAFGLQARAHAAPELLLKDDRSWDGGEIAYPEGKPEISSVRLTLKEGKVAPYHCHPVPTLGYIKKGKVRLETQGGKTVEYGEDASVVEVMKTVHRGVALDGDAEIIVFYAGAKDIPTTVFPKDKEAFEQYCQ